MGKLTNTVSHRKAGDEAGALAILKSNEGRDAMLGIRAENAAFDRVETNVLFERQAAASILRSLLVGLIVAALIVPSILVYFVRKNECTAIPRPTYVC